MFKVITWGQISKWAMIFILISHLQVLIICLLSSMDLNLCTFKHSSLSQPLNNSQNPLSAGFQGLVNAKLTRLTCAQSSITKGVNYVPWSTVIEADNLRLCVARSKTKITSWLVSLKPVPVSTLSRLQLLTTVSPLKANRLASWSWTKPSSSVRLGHWLVAACLDAKTCSSYDAGASDL